MANEGNTNQNDCCVTNTQGAPCCAPFGQQGCGVECADPSQNISLRQQCDREQWYLNEAQAYTASCPSGFEGEPVTVTVPAGYVPSNISVADANEIALGYARELAESQIVCQGLYYNTEQTATVICPFGPNKQATTPAGQYTSTESQDAANTLAYAAAAQEAALLCDSE